MKNRVKLVLLVTALLVVSTTADRSFAQTANELFQKGVQLEEVKGELEKAIEVYKKVVESSKGNKPLAARALLRLGKCYEKLGMAEAKRSYERILREFGDQASAVKEARARLAILTRIHESVEKPALTTRQVWAGPSVDILGSSSSDGKYLTFVDWETGDLAIRDVVTGEKRRLTHKKDWFESFEFALFSVFSPDNKQIAYDWFNKDAKWEMRLIGVEGSTPRILYRNEEVEYLQTFDWSPDGRHIAAVFSRKDATNQIVLVSPLDGSVRVLKSFDWRFPQGLRFSPDGRFLAYDFPPVENSQERDVFLLATDGSAELPLVEHPADDFVLGWSSDGTMLLFASSRTGTMDAWALPVNEGKPVRTAELIKRDIGRVRAMGLTKKGAFYYGVQTGMKDIFFASFDPVSGQVASPTKVSQRFIGSNSDPAWSIDGRYLAYVSNRRPNSVGPGSRILVIRSLDNGQEQELTLKLNYFYGPRWTSDGKSIIVKGTDNKGREGLYKVDIKTQEATPYLTQTILGTPVFSLDGKIMYYVRIDSSKLNSLIARDLQTGEEKELHQGFKRNLTLSPDGRQLAFSTVGEKYIAVKLLPTVGGEPRELVRLNQEIHPSIAWTADGRYLLFTKRLFTKRNKEVKEVRELWRVSIEGGEPENTGLALNGLDQVRMHPDGKRIAFTTGEDKQEVWVMENFLPREEKGISEAKSTKLLLSGSEATGEISPDESRIAYVDWSSANPGSLVLKNLRTGETRVLEDSRYSGGYYWERFAGNPTWSPDGQSIAYSWYLNKDPWFDVRMVSSRGGQPKILHANREMTLFPMDWSADGRFLLCEMMKADKSVALGTLSVSTGEVRQLISLEWNRPGSARFSPNGKFIAYDLQRDDNRDIYVLSIDGKQSARVTDASSEETNPTWSYDGKYILFSSNRRGTWDLWAIEMNDGIVRGESFLVKSDFGNYPKRMMPTGRLVYNVSNTMRDVFFVQLNPLTGEVNEGPKLMTKSFYGQHWSPTWSANGKRVAYLRGNEPPVLYVLNLDDGKEERIQTGMRYPHYPLWSPDAKSIAIRGTGPKGKWGVYLYSFEKRTIRALVENQGPQDSSSSFRTIGWSGDGKEFLGIREVTSGERKYESVVAVDVTTGKERMIAQAVPYLTRTYVRYSRDQRKILYVEREPGGDAASKQRLVILDLSTGEKKKLAEAEEPITSINEPSWSRDETKVAYNYSIGPAASGRTELRILDLRSMKESRVNGGSMNIAMFLPPTWSPDGTKIAFTLREDRNELWVMENYLTMEERAQK